MDQDRIQNRQALRVYADEILIHTRTQVQGYPRTRVHPSSALQFTQIKKDNKIKKIKEFFKIDFELLKNPQNRVMSDFRPHSPIIYRKAG